MEDRSFIHLCSSPSGAVLISESGRSLSVKTLESLRKQGVKGTTAEVFYQFAV